MHIKLKQVLSNILHIVYYGVCICDIYLQITSQNLRHFYIPCYRQIMFQKFVTNIQNLPVSARIKDTCFHAIHSKTLFNLFIASSNVFLGQATLMR